MQMHWGHAYHFKGFEIRFKPHADNLRGLKKHDDTNLASSSLSFFKALTQGVGAVGELLIKSVFVATSWDGFG